MQIMKIRNRSTINMANDNEIYPLSTPYNINTQIGLRLKNHPANVAIETSKKILEKKDHLNNSTFYVICQFIGPKFKRSNNL